MPRAALSSQDYITPASVSVLPSFNDHRYSSSGTRRSEFVVYSDLRPEPLSSRRKRFIGTNVAFVILHLCAMLTLVLFMTVRRPQRRNSAWGEGGCELCDLWCTSNCSRLKTGADPRLLMLISADDVNATQGKDKDLCCIERRNSLSTIYEKLKPSSDNSQRKKIFDGIRLKDKWTEDDHNNWPRISQSVLQFDKKEKSFKTSVNGTFSVHSRIDFYCGNHNNMSKQILNVKSHSRGKAVAVAVDERAQLGPSTSTRNGTVVYTSTVNVIVELKKGGSMEFITDPERCASPRTLVVFQSKEE